jgi:hypothetical protein
VPESGLKGRRDSLDGTISVSGSSRIEKFHRIQAGLGVPEQDDGYLCVVGQRLDGRYHCLWEKSGSLADLGPALIESSRTLLVEQVFMDCSDRLALEMIRTFGVSDRCENSSQAPLFGQTPEELFIVRCAQDRLVLNFRTALEKTRVLIDGGRILIHEGNCPRLMQSMGLRIQELMTSSVMKALVWVVSALETAGSADKAPHINKAPWYGNFSRRL